MWCDVGRFFRDERFFQQHIMFLWLFRHSSYCVMYLRARSLEFANLFLLLISDVRWNTLSRRSDPNVGSTRLQSPLYTIRGRRVLIRSFTPNPFTFINRSYLSRRPSRFKAWCRMNFPLSDLARFSWLCARFLIFDPDAPTIDHVVRCTFRQYLVCSTASSNHGELLFVMPYVSLTVSHHY